MSFLSRLTRRLRPPILTTPRSSEQLLRSLQNSFKEHLDREHPAKRNTQSGPVDSHVNAIVTSPLFTRSTSPEAVRQGAILSPVEYFTHQIATGNATICIAKECLWLNRNNGYPVFEKSEEIAHQTTLTRSVLRWLWSSGLDESMEFSHDMKFVNLLLDSMQPEARLSYASKWYKQISSLYLTKFNSSQESYNEFVKPLANLFRRIVLHKGSIASKNIRQKVITQDYITTSNMISKEIPLPTRRRILITALNPIVDSILRGATFQEVDLIYYDHFVAFIKENPVGGHFVSSVLDLKHPLNPSALTAWTYLRTLSIEDTKRMQSSKRERVFALAGQTIEFLLACGETKKAKKLLDRLQGSCSSRKTDGDTISEAPTASSNLVIAV